MVSIFGKHIRKQAGIIGRSAPDVRYVRLGVLAAIVLSVVSFITTWFGFRGILTFGADNYLLLIVAWVIAFLLTFGVQAILLISVFAFRATKRLTRVRWFATYIIAVFISVGFGYGFYFDVFSAKRLQVENTRKVMRDFLQPLNNFEASYGAFVANLARMDQHATRMANVEQTRGGTCGDNSGRSFGPRTQLRLDDAAAFRSYHARFKAQLAQIRARIAEIKKINPSGGGQALFDLGNKLNLQWAELRKVMAANTRGGKGLGADLLAFRQFLASTQVNRGRVARAVNFRGRVVRQRCPDPFLQAEARAMLTRINNLNTALPPPPQVFNAKDRVEVIGLGFYRLIDEIAALPGAVFGFLSVRAVRDTRTTTPPAATAASADSLYVLPTGYAAFRIWWFPLLVGAIVDILIFLAAYTSEGRGDLRAERIIGEVIARVNPPRHLRPAMAAALKAFRHGNHVVMPAAWTGPPLHDPGNRQPQFIEPTPASLVSGVLDVLMAHNLVTYKGQMKADKFLVRKSGWYSGPLNKMVHTPSQKPKAPKYEAPPHQAAAGGAAAANGAGTPPSAPAPPAPMRVDAPQIEPPLGAPSGLSARHDPAIVDSPPTAPGHLGGDGVPYGDTGTPLAPGATPAGANGGAAGVNGGNGANGHPAHDSVNGGANGTHGSDGRDADRVQGEHGTGATGATADSAAPDPAELGADADVYLMRRRVFEELLYQLQNAPAVMSAYAEDEAPAAAAAEDATADDDVISERRRLEYTDGKRPPHQPGQA